MDILGRHLGFHEPRVRRINQNIRVLLVQMCGQIARVQYAREFRATILAVGAQVGVEFVEGRELDVLGGALVGVGGLDLDADGVFLAGLLEQRQQVRRQHDVADVVDGHVSVDAGLGQLVRHDPPPGVLAVDVQSVRLVSHFPRHLRHGAEVGHVALEPDDSVRVVGAQFRLDFLDRLVFDVFREGHDEDFG